jgi:phosphotransferase system HPr-like phosphotransfer protein
MEKNDGTWMTFNEFFNSKITLNLDGKEVNMSDLSAIERLKLWSNQYKKRMGFK